MLSEGGGPQLFLSASLPAQHHLEVLWNGGQRPSHKVGQSNY